MVGYSLGIGKIGGVDIELNWLFIALLLVILLVSLADFVLWVLIFACVLIHELVHAWVAKRRRISVKRIILYPFGGGTVVNQEDLNPPDEFLVSISGPIASLVLALVFLPFSIIIHTGYLGSLLNFLFLINLVLGIFNILPWLPLDGGRVLRSYIQRREGYLAATKKAVLYSNVITVMFIVGSVAYALLNSSYSVSYKEVFVLFSIVVAMFVYGGAEAELTSALVREGVKGLHVGDAISRNYLLVSQSTSIAALRRRFASTRDWDRNPHTILFRKSHSVYLFSSASLQRSARRAGTRAPSVGSFGERLLEISPDKSLYYALDEMNADGVGTMAVTKGGRLIGILPRQRVEYIISLHMVSSANLGHKTVK
jgi:Zn-dependent protease